MSTSNPMHVVVLFATVLLFLTGCSPALRMSSELLKAHKQYAPIPLLSQSNPDLTIESAYEVQTCYVRKRLRGSLPAGFKAGLTSEAAQKRFGIKHPVAGVLDFAGSYFPDDVIDGKDYRVPMIECEIAFVVGTEITAPVHDLAHVPSFFTHIAPAIEFPDLGFADPKQLTAADLVAANVSAAGFIVGKHHPLSVNNPNDLSVTLFRSSQRQSFGQGKDNMGDQWKAVQWLINRTIASGHKIQPGQVLLTGAIGKMLPADPGHYVADFGDLGTLRFEIR